LLLVIGLRPRSTALPCFVRGHNGIDAMKNYEYDVCLSFAGAQRPYVEEVAAILRRRGARVFYDDYERSRLWGKDLYEHLDFVYRKAARYCIVFVSADYAHNSWTTHERKSIYARVLDGDETYLLPARFDDTELPGLRDTIGYVDLRTMTAADLAALLIEKLDLRARMTHHHTWPNSHSGRVWIRIRPTPASDGQVHVIALRWGPWRRDVVAAVSAQGLTLMTTKAQEEVAVPLTVRVDPGALVTFGMNESDDRSAISIDEDWYPHQSE
jgi:hypothetical protein